MNFRRAGLVITILVAVTLLVLNRKQVTLVRQTDFVLKKITTNGYELSWIITMHNPNLLSSTIQKINEKVIVDGTELSELHLELSQGIPGTKETSFPVSIRFENTDVTFDTLSFPILLKGEISFSNLTGGGVIRVNESDTVHLYI